MLARVIIRTIKFAIRRAWLVIGISTLLAVASGTYAAGHFALNANIGELISSDLPWRKREAVFLAVFPRYDSILVVVEAPTPELVEHATGVLTEALTQNSDLFRSVSRPGGGQFFLRNGLLFQSSEDVAAITWQLVKAEPLIHDLAADPSLRGLADGLTDALMGVQAGRLNLDALSRPLTMAADTIENVMAGHRGSFSWHDVVQGRSGQPSELRRYIDVRPVLHYGALEPGRGTSFRENGGDDGSQPPATCSMDGRGARGQDRPDSWTYCMVTRGLTRYDVVLAEALAPSGRSLQAAK